MRGATPGHRDGVVGVALVEPVSDVMTTAGPMPWDQLRPISTRAVAPTVPIATGQSRGHFDSQSEGRTGPTRVKTCARSPCHSLAEARSNRGYGQPAAATPAHSVSTRRPSRGRGRRGRMGWPTRMTPAAAAGSGSWAAHVRHNVTQRRSPGLMARRAAGLMRSVRSITLNEDEEAPSRAGPSPGSSELLLYPAGLWVLRGPGAPWARVSARLDDVQKVLHLNRRPVARVRSRRTSTGADREQQRCSPGDRVDRRRATRHRRGISPAGPRRAR
jgi:hypothetical protein